MVFAYILNSIKLIKDSYHRILIKISLYESFVRIGKRKESIKRTIEFRKNLQLQFNLSKTELEEERKKWNMYLVLDERTEKE